MVVKDVYFAYFMLGLVASAAVLYAVRLATQGVARSERVARIGGTALVGQDVMDCIEEQYPDWVNELAQSEWEKVGGWG